MIKIEESLIRECYVRKDFCLTNRKNNFDYFKNLLNSIRYLLYYLKIKKFQK